MNTRCLTCGHSALARNNEHFECSHVDCPHRRHCWSEHPTKAQLFKGPWPKSVDVDPKPLDEEFK